MSSTMKLKDEARRYEQQEDWGRAIELYRRALEEQETGDAELGLYNRIGDLYLRLGETKSAVEYYVQAADRYAEAGFLNNAIALCNKALRYEPDRVPLYERLGRLCADQGFLTDARRWFLEYAARLAAAGQMDASLGALKEFAELSQDADVWAQLGRQYSSQGRAEDALASYARAVAAYAEAGDADRAEEVAAEARALDPDFEPPAGPPLEAGEWASEIALQDPEVPSRDALAPPTGVLGGDDTHRDDGLALSTPAVTSADDAFESDLVDFTGSEDVATEPVERADAEPDYVPLSVDSLLGEQPDYGGADERAGEPGTGAALHEAYPDDEGYADDEEDEPLPLLEADDGPMPMPEWTDVASSETVPEAHEGVAEPGEFALPIVAGADPDEADIRLEDGFDTLARADPDVDERQEPAVADIAPAFGSAGGVVPGAAPVTDAEPDVDVPDDIPVEFVAPRTPEDRARALIAEGREDDALDILEHAAGAAEEREATHEALRLADVMVELAPRSVRALRLRADSARRADDRDRLVPAYAALAERLRESGDAEAARKAYERVLAADPSHEGARSALAPATPPPAGAPSAGGAGRAASPGDYVDLAALVGEETLETTRFVVEEEVPTGDEDQDFHEMLSQFRSKVSEHVSVEDTASHYDLGIAFKEMGLIDEAIAEFQTALRFGAQRLKVYEELGQCFMEKGNYAIAEKLLRQGSNEMATDPSELLGVNYHLGRCYEQLDRPEDAREAYERVLSLDIDFRDVSERLERL